MECIFCRLVRNEVPRWLVYEDSDVIAFLPKQPVAFGHTLVAPKEHHPDLTSIPSAILMHMTEITQELTRRYRERISADGVNLLLASGPAAQQSVPHLHFHLIPRFLGDGLDLWPALPSQAFDKDEMLRRLTGAPPA